MVQKRTIEVVIPQMSSQSINSTTKSNEVVSKTVPAIPLATINEEQDLCSPNSPRRTNDELQSKLNNGKMSSMSSLLGHFFSGAREEGKEKEDAEVVRGANPPHRTNDRLFNRGGDNHQASATSSNRREEDIKREVENTYETNLPHRAGVRVRFELDNHEISTPSSASNETTPQMTPTSSLVDEMEGDLIDLYDDNDDDGDDTPLRHTGEEFLSDEFEFEPHPHPHQNLHRAPKSFIISQHPPTQTKAPPTSPQTHRTPSANIISTSPRAITKHEIFLHTLPSKHASVPQIRTWIASWFSGRDIAFAVPWEDENIGLQRYIECISWSGHDIHHGSCGSLENDMRGWMLGGYATPIVRDIEKARNMERERKWEVAVGRFTDFLYGAVVMGVVGLVLMVLVPCPCRRY
ncbi:uncharacterized protein EAF02_002751 [Botrytis sinoallii]|uniref:uncharacterized protein n=1 Tax=Botrytis sinoallii TaxID=1463999 RepID=UPI0019011A65|nr:uncharacterized protein EAF02_002751 [Botrytis sinoallii]KAF7888210.1 hypothetical protein EAF02_002751 [Botrytis sinoallii]